MAYIKRPQKGEKALQSIYDSLISVIDYLPTLTVRGDNNSTYVEHSAGGTIIHVKQNANPDQAGGKTYYAGSGLTLSGNIFNNAHTSGRFIQITSGNAINCTLSGGDYIQITPEGRINYTGDPSGGGGGGYQYFDGRFITISSDYTINCTLSALEQLYNYPLVASSNIVMPNSLTACNNTVDISQVGTIYSNHFIQTRDILYDGLGTKVSLAWMRNPFGDVSPEGTNGIVQGLQVDLTLSGGRFADVVLHKHVYGASDPNTGTRYDPPTESRVDCLLTGTYDHYPHTSGFIDIVPVEMEDGKTWGVISTNLHAGSGITIDPQTGEISCDGGGGGTIVIASGVGYPDNSQLYPDDYAGASGLGISWLIPVSAGQEYRFYTDATGGEDEEENTIQVAYGKFAPSVGETGTASSLTNGSDFIPDSNGWVRISVFDNGRNEGSCLRFYVNDEDGEYATPLYRFHGFTNYTAGSGIAINSGIISCMIQTGQGLTSTALYDGNSNPYDPNRPITGIAFDLSTQFFNDLTTIGNRSGNKVLCSNGNNLVWTASSTFAGDGFKAPDFAKLQVQNDAGESAIGLGTTYLVPVASGKNVKYSADGGTIIAVWAPVEGSSKSAHEVTTTNWTTTDDGYVRISVIDDGTLSAGCLRLYVDNKDIPLHKFAMFNYSSGAIYEGGRYIDIQTTSTRINAETQLEEEYTLENPIINNMLTGGRFVTIQQTETVGGVEQELEYPRINCTLQAGTGIDINEQSGIISCTVQETNWRSLTPSLLAVDNNNHTLSAATQSGGGGGGGGSSDLSTCYITTQGEYTVVPNTRYCVIPIASLSTNVIDFPDMNPTSISSYETDNYQRIYKYFYNGFSSRRPDYMYTTTSATIDDVEQYGAYDPKNSNWKNYKDGVGVGNIFVFEPQGQDCVVEIDCGVGGNSIAIAPSGLIFSTYSSDVISGTAESWYEAWRDDSWPPQYYSSDLQNWRWDLSRGTKYIFIYDHTTNIWSCLQG